jgi:hypothetical protein
MYMNIALNSIYAKPSIQRYGLTNLQYRAGVGAYQIHPDDWYKKPGGSVYFPTEHYKVFDGREWIRIPWSPLPVEDQNRTPIDGMHLRFKELVLELQNQISEYLSFSGFISLEKWLNLFPATFSYIADEEEEAEYIALVAMNHIERDRDLIDFTYQIKYEFADVYSLYLEADLVQAR